MRTNDQRFRVSADVDGETATLQLVPDDKTGRVYVWLDPGLDPELVVPFYRVTERGSDPVESWQNFQDGADVAPYAGERRALLGAIAELEPGEYTIDAQLFTGFETVRLPGIDIELSSVTEAAADADARADFNAAFMALFERFLEKHETAEAAEQFQAGFDAGQAGFLVDAIVELGAPHDHAESETSDMTGFFEFIEFLTAVVHSGGAAVHDRLHQQPDSPTNQHYIKYLKEYLGNDRILEGILEKYPFCA